VYPVKVTEPVPTASVLFADGKGDFLDEESPFQWDWDSSLLVSAGSWRKINLTVNATATSGDTCFRAQPVYVVDASEILVDFDFPLNDMCLFGSPDAKMVFGGGAGRDHLDLYIDDVLLGTKASQPWKLPIATVDAKGEPAFEDGAYTLEVVGIEDGTGAEVRATRRICIDNASECDSPPESCDWL
jgi:hypothetical protein